MPQIGGRRWKLTRRAGMSPAEAGARGGSAGSWSPPRPMLTRREAAMRWLMGEATQAELADEYGVCLSTMRRWCSSFEQSLGD